MVAGIEGEASIESRRLISPRDRDHRVRELMSDEPDQEGRNQIQGVDDEGDGVAEHDHVSIGKTKKAPISRSLWNE
jgi:hypothetical protein